ncbi:nAChR subunit ShAR1 beta2 [Echinococcus multilocularis]|uniref:NAChR subunit ShAR1 beta2 n=1 Tax=Echinococcus multilocularis TaxID=6211 RepID=A0A068YB59_ECHMU|nr:nAChR subunit ShAR1 beta2 [Echinococcus multilocularis]
MGKMNYRPAEKPMESEISRPEGSSKLSKSPGTNPKKKALNGAKSALKEPRLPSSIILPGKLGEINENLDDASLLAEIRRRICDQNAKTIRVSPVPKICPPLLLRDLCPTSVAVRIPSKQNCRYAFIKFASSTAAEAAAKEVTGKLVGGKAIKAILCSERPPRVGADWKSPEERELDAFDLTTLFVSCLPRLTERTTLAQIFRTADKIKYESLPDGTSKGFCILKYRTRELAQKAFVELHGTLLKGVPISVNFLIKSKEKAETGETVKEEASHEDLKRKAPEGSEEVMKPNKKRRCENTNAEDGKVVSDPSGQTREIPTKIKVDRTRNDTVSLKKADKGPNFYIKYSKGPEPKRAKLQPYQLSKKSGRRAKKPKKSK